MEDGVSIRRKPWLAGLLSSICLGLGQAYCGRWKRGIVLYAISVVTALAATGFGLSNFPILNVSLMGLFLIWIYAYIIYDAIRLAKLINTSNQVRSAPKWYFYLIYFLVIAVIILPPTKWFARKYWAQTFRIPSGSMASTLYPGDYILAKKFPYYKNPNRGDVVVFLYPKDESRFFVKRVIGLPDDKIEIKNQKVFINDLPLDEPYAAHIESPDLTLNSLRDNLAPLTVPKDKFFVLGDNRENSFDSRHFGLIDVHKIKGTAKTIYFFWDGSSIRWQRMGSIIR